MDPQYFPLIIASVATIGIVATIAVQIYSGRRAKQQRLLNAGDRFRSVFASTVAAMESGRSDVFTFRAREDAAIVEFRGYLSKRKRAGFGAACEQYREFRKRAYPIPDAFGQVKTFPGNEEVRTECAKALKSLLSYADKVSSA